MTYEETIKIMAMLSAFYGEGKSDARIMANAWHLVLDEFDYRDAEKAVIEFAKNDTRDYASFPAPGRIVEEIRAQEKKCNGLYNKLYNGVPYEQLNPWERAMISQEQYIRGLALSEEEIRAKREDIINGFRERKHKIEGRQTLSLTTGEE